MEPIDHGEYSTADNRDYKLWGTCHKVTPGQYVLLTLIINVIFWRRGGAKKAVKLMKDTDEHLYS